MAPAEQHEPKKQRRHRRRRREQLGSEEQVARQQAGSGERQLVDGSHHAVARWVEYAALDLSRALGVGAVEVGLGAVVADAVRAQGHEQQGDAEERERGDRENRAERFPLRVGARLGMQDDFEPAPLGTSRASPTSLHEVGRARFAAGRRLA